MGEASLSRISLFFDKGNLKSFQRETEDRQLKFNP